MQSRGTEQQQTVLVIDDSVIVLEMTRKALEAAGYRVLTRDKPAGCVALLLHEKPALVLLDVNMPTIAGDTIANMFGKAQPNSETIVLLHSSLSQDVLHARAAASGAHGYIQKTSDQFELVRHVNRWLRAGRSSSSKWRVAPAVHSPEDNRPSSGSLRAEPGSVSEDRLLVERGFSKRPSGSLRVDCPLVLFVDDEMAVLSTYRRSVQSQELIAEFALSGAQALKRLQTSPPVDVVVCDVVLGDMSGAEVYKRAVALDSRFRDRFVFATGSESAEAGADLLKHFNAQMLYKPVSTERLREILRSIVHRPITRSGSL